MTHIDCHIAFVKACANLEKLGFTNNAFADFADCQRLIKQGNIARRKCNLAEAQRLFNQAEKV